MPKREKERTMLGVIGVIFLIIGGIITIPLAIKGLPYAYGLIGTLIMVIIGIILIAWAFTD